MRSVISLELFINIFIPNTPLHDGAVIIQNGQNSAAGCYLPLSENPFISKELGTRHRAAIGISEVGDAISVVVSEETGQVSLALNGQVVRDIKEESSSPNCMRSSGLPRPLRRNARSSGNGRGRQSNG